MTQNSAKIKGGTSTAPKIWSSKTRLKDELSDTNWMALIERSSKNTKCVDV